MSLIHILLKLASYVTVEHFPNPEVSLSCVPLITVKGLFGIAMLLHKGLFLVLEFHLGHSTLFHGHVFCSPHCCINYSNFPCFIDVDGLEDNHLGSFLITS